ncbi:MAG: leucine-rich repeat protein [Lachnospiraceae bacterium]|nr:leucine-rich repeat protein [Lachnospiraceae bacterium]
MRDKKNWKRLIALAISAVLLVPVQVGYAAESGIEACTESREADENGFVIDENGALTKYTGDAENVVIPDHVTSVEDYAFQACYDVKSIYIPASVQDIGWSAFAIENSVIDWGDGDISKVYGSLKNLEVASDNPYFSSEDGVLYDKNKEKLICCPNLRTGSFAVPAGVKIIGGRAFESCQLTSIEIPAGVTEIRDTYFTRNSQELTELNVESGNQKFSSEGGILYDKDKKELLTCPSGKVGNIDIPQGVTSIAPFSFQACSNLSNIRIPSSVTRIGEAAFGLVWANIIIPAEVTYIGTNAIDSGMTIYGKEGSYAQTYAAENDIKFSTEQPGFEIKDGVLEKYSGMDTEVVIPDEVTSIGDEAFHACTGLTSIEMPDGLTSIGKNAFAACRSLTEIMIPDGVTSIERMAFYKCTSLTKITLPESLTSIGEDVFSNRNEDLIIYGKSGSAAETYAKENDIKFFSTGISSQKTLSDKDVTLSQTSYTYDGTAKTPDVTVKCGNETLTKDADYTVTYQDNVNAGTAKVIVSGIGNYTGAVTKTFTITEGDKQEPGTKELSKCAITLSKTAYAYDGTAKNSTITVKDGATVLKAGTDYTVAYQNNRNAGTAKAVITGNGNYKGTVTKTFTITVKKGTSHKAGSYQYKVTGVSTVTITGLTDRKVTKVEVPKTVKIGGKNFKVTAIGNNAFRKNKKVTSVEIGNNVTAIGTSAFEGCTKLNKAAIGTGVIQIENSVFKNCKKLGTITVKSTKLTKVGKSALRGIESTAKVKVPAKNLSSNKKLFKNKGQGKNVKIVKS